ncbi:MAG: hypothetical protein C4333_00855 [Meiothermus sp.]
MTGRYVLTSQCLNSGTMTLTQSLRQFLKNKETARFVDEDGEVYECKVEWSRGRIAGLHAYYAKRRLAVNEVIGLSFDGEVIGLEALHSRPPRPAPKAPVEAEPKPEPQPETPPPAQRRVKVTPYPTAVMYPHAPAAEAPGFSADLERLGLSRERNGPPWFFRASLGRRAYTLALCRLGECEPLELLELRRQGSVQYAGLVAGESMREEALAELAQWRPSGLGGGGLCYISPEALQKLAKLRQVFPVGPVEVERFLKTGRLDLESLHHLEDELEGILGERAAFSSVLLSLAEMPQQSVFLLADLVGSDLPLEADTVRQILDVLVGPPFLLLKRLSPGEYLLRATVADALAEFTQYARLMATRAEAVLR